MKKILTVEGMSCSHCAKHVKDALEELNGVVSADVNLNSKTAIIESSADVKDEDIKAAINDAGYEVTNIKTLN